MMTVMKRFEEGECDSYGEKWEAWSYNLFMIINLVDSVN